MRLWMQGWQRRGRRGQLGELDPLLVLVDSGLVLAGLLIVFGVASQRRPPRWFELQ